MPTPLMLESITVVDVEPPVATSTLTIVPLHIVAPSVPVPTLVDGIPQ